MRRKINDVAAGESPCPHCGGAVINVQGVAVCGRCSWMGG